MAIFRYLNLVPASAGEVLSRQGTRSDCSFPRMGGRAFAEQLVGNSIPSVTSFVGSISISSPNLSSSPSSALLVFLDGDSTCVSYASH